MYGATKNCLCVTIVLACFVLCTSASFAQDITKSGENTSENKDIYDRISTLVDSLRVWSEEPVTDRNNRTAGEDTLDLVELFPNCQIEPVDSNGTIRILLPMYMDLLTSSLMLVSQDNTKPEGQPIWRVPVTGKDNYLLVDEVAVPCDSQVVNDPDLLQHIGAQLALLRTIGLPSHLQAPVVSSDCSEVMVTVRGRDTVDIPYRVDNWLRTLSHLAGGCQVYAGLLEANSYSNISNLRYYILITYPGAIGHHFIEWRENLDMVDEVWHIEKTEAIFTPYIRTDNLKNLFTQPVKPDREQIELRIR
ncbi:MAG: hypothetical protein P9X24_03720 [Candidatus Hatepunaea meridiana]|nr:hypothetical protein [Candidatus Hatepunaea meridiana]